MREQESREMSCKLMYELYYESKQLSRDELEANPC